MKTFIYKYIYIIDKYTEISDYISKFCQLNISISSVYITYTGLKSIDIYTLDVGESLVEVLDDFFDVFDFDFMSGVS